MERCPNCGATVREGARFCTACGFRMTAAHDEPVGDTVLTSERSAWWGPREEEPVEPASVADQPPPVDTTSPDPGGSFWDRIEDATRDDQPAELTQRWEPAASGSPLGDPEVETHAEEGQDGTDEVTSTVIFTARPPDERPPETGWDDGAPQDEAEAGIRADTTAATASEGERAPETAAAEATSASSPAHPPAGSLVAELDRLGRLLASARPQREPNFSSELSELQAAVQDARDRPREIDAMLAISARLEIIDHLIASNQRMTSAIDDAILALRGAEPAD